MAIWTPDNYQRDQQVNEVAHLAIQFAKDIDRELKKFDPLVDLVLAGENATDPDIRPGEWHLRRRNRGYAHTYMPLPRDADGNPTLPGPWLIDWLKQNDMWNPRIAERIRTANQRDRDRRTKQGQLEREGMADNFAADYRAAKRVRDDRGMKRSSAKKRKGLVGHK